MQISDISGAASKELSIEQVEQLYLTVAIDNNMTIKNKHNYPIPL